MKAHNPSCSSGGDIRPPFWPVPWWFQVMASSVSLIHHQKNTCNGAIMLVSAPSLYFRIWKILLTLSLIILNMPNLFITSQVFSLHGNMLVRFFLCVCPLSFFEILESELNWCLFFFSPFLLPVIILHELQFGQVPDFCNHASCHFPRQQRAAAAH